MSRLPKTRVFDLPCRFGERTGKARVYLGEPAEGFHPLHFQREWLRESRNGEFDPAAVDAVSGDRPCEPELGEAPPKTPPPRA